MISKLASYVIQDDCYFLSPSEVNQTIQSLKNYSISLREYSTFENVNLSEKYKFIFFGSENFNPTELEARFNEFFRAYLESPNSQISINEQNESVIDFIRLISSFNYFGLKSPPDFKLKIKIIANDGSIKIRDLNSVHIHREFVEKLNLPFESAIFFY